MSTALETLAKQPIWHGFVVSTPDTCGGKPRIDGTRVRVQDVYFWYEVQGSTIDEIIKHFPRLTRAGIHAALSYYWDHQQEIDQAIREDERLIADTKKSLE